MKKYKRLFLFAGMLAVLNIQTGCFGNFALTRQVYTWNESLGDKFVQSLVMWIMLVIPVYEAVGIVDFIFLNVIEFWTGANPLAMNEGDIQQQLVTMNGTEYKITATRDRFHIEALSGDQNGKTADLVFNRENLTWSVEQNGNSEILVGFKMNSEGTGIENVQNYALSL